jgi:hypothetical protein
VESAVPPIDTTAASTEPAAEAPTGLGAISLQLARIASMDETVDRANELAA